MTTGEQRDCSKVSEGQDAGPEPLIHGTGRTIGSRINSEEEGIRLSIYAEIRTSGADPSGFLDILCSAVEREVWTKLRDKDGNALTFRQFIEAPYPVGVGSTVDAVAKLVRLSHRYEAGSPERAAKLATMRRAVDDLVNEPINPNGTNQWSGDRNPTPTDTDERGRDYDLRRLKRDRGDLAGQVVAGALSANEAAIAAGFKRRRVSVYTDDPVSAAQTLLRHCDLADIEAIARAARQIMDSRS